MVASSKKRGVVRTADDDQENNAARWWFKNIVVPIVGGGGIVAVIVAIISLHTADSKGTSGQAQFAFTVSVNIPSAPPMPSLNPPPDIYDINLYLDDALAAHFKSEGNGFHEEITIHASRIGMHQYSLMGIEKIGNPYGGSFDHPVTGQGQIYVQDGGEFSLEHDHQAQDNHTWLLRRTK